MYKESKNTEHIDEEEFVRAFLKFRSFSPEKRAFALAFMNGMEFQKSISEAESNNIERKLEKAGSLKKVTL